MGSFRKKLLNVGILEILCRLFDELNNFQNIILSIISKLSLEEDIKISFCKDSSFFIKILKSLEISEGSRLVNEITIVKRACLSEELRKIASNDNNLIKNDE